MLKEDQLDETDFESFMVCKRWKALDKKRGENKEKGISEYVIKVKDFISERERRRQLMMEQRDLYSFK